MTDDATSLIREHDQLYSEQTHFRTYWEQVAYYVLPSHATFLNETPEGTRRTERLFDGTAVMANERFAAVMEQMLTPRTQQWHTLKPENDALLEDQEVSQYLDMLTKRLFSMRYRPGANYASQQHECYVSLGPFGNYLLFIDEDRDVRGFSYRAIPMQECVWATDHQGRVDCVYRKFKLEARQMEDKFGRSVLPAKVTAVLDSAPFTKFEILHVVKPNPDFKERAAGVKGKKFVSYYLAVEGKQILETKGYRCFPYAVGRYNMAPRENYGRGAGMTCFPAIKTLNEEKKTILRAGQKSVDPPLLAYEEGVMEAFNQRSGAMNYGVLTADGQALVQPLKIDANVPLGLELMNLEKTEINDAFLVSLFQILAENPGMSATEAMIRAQEKGTLMAPAGGRLMSESLGAQIEREIDIAFSFPGLLPPPPKQLILGGGYQIEYQSPLSRSMRASEGNSILQTAQGISVLASIDPKVKDVVDWEGAARDYAEISGMPSKYILNDEQLQAIREQQNEQLQAQQIVQGAPMVTQSVKNMAQAQQAFSSAAQSNSPSPSTQAAA